MLAAARRRLAGVHARRGPRRARALPARLRRGPRADRPHADTRPAAYGRGSPPAPAAAGSSTGSTTPTRTRTAGSSAPAATRATGSSSSSASTSPAARRGGLRPALAAPSAAAGRGRAPRRPPGRLRRPRLPRLLPPRGHARPHLARPQRRGRRHAAGHPPRLVEITATSPPWMTLPDALGCLARDRWVPPEQDSPPGPAFQPDRWDAEAFAASAGPARPLQRGRRVRRPREGRSIAAAIALLLVATRAVRPSAGGRF